MEGSQFPRGILDTEKGEGTSGQEPSPAFVKDDQLEEESGIKMEPESKDEAENARPVAAARRSPPARHLSINHKAWGDKSYSDLLTEAICSSPIQAMTIHEIYQWFCENIQQLAGQQNCPSTACWKNTIRHTLSKRKRFVRLLQFSDRRSLWTLRGNVRVVPESETFDDQLARRQYYHEGAIFYRIPRYHQPSNVMPFMNYETQIHERFRPQSSRAVRPHGTFYVRERGRDGRRFEPHPAMQYFTETDH